MVDVPHSVEWRAHMINWIAHRIKVEDRDTAVQMICAGLDTAFDEGTGAAEALVTNINEKAQGGHLRTISIILSAIKELRSRNRQVDADTMEALNG